MLYIPISFNNTIQACYNDEKYTVLIKKSTIYFYHMLQNYVLEIWYFED